MTYQKLQVSNGLAVIPSDTVNIPNPDTEILSSNNGAFAGGGALIDANLEGPDGKCLAQVGDIIYNVTAQLAYYVTQILASTFVYRTPTTVTLGLSEYVIYRKKTPGCILFSGVAGDISTQLAAKSEELGDNVVINGNFATDSDWVKTQATISGGKATIVTTGSYAGIIQNNVFEVGKTYFYSIEVSIYNGTMQLSAGSGTEVDITTSGVKTGYIVANSTDLEIKRKLGAGALDVTIDNVSAREYTLNERIFKGIAAGSFLPTQTVRVNETDTTATDIIALW